MSITLQFQGATEGVTGSCHQILLDDQSLLIDCGIFQGAEARRDFKPDINFDISHLKGLVLTHAHIDHIGRLPYLLAAGYKGPIYSSIPTSYLVPEQLEDALNIGFTKNKQLIQRFISLIKQRFVPCKYKQWITVSDKFRIKFHPAGHILGSSFIEVDVVQDRDSKKSKQATRKRILFSGDLGAPYTPILSAPSSPYRANILVLESTYGDKIHTGRKERRKDLLRILKKCISDNGIVIIPAFAIGRTQELLYELNYLVESKKLPKLPVIIDSPLAAKFTTLYSKLNSFWDDESKRCLENGDDPFLFPGLISVNSHREHLKILKWLENNGGPAIVIAGSGMCTGGRIINYLQRFIHDHKNDVLFVGYQGFGTLGREILNSRITGYKCSKYVMIEGKRIKIKAGVYALNGYSAHADKDDLVRWVKKFREKPEKIFLVHGEKESKNSLKNELIKSEYKVTIARKRKYYV